mmetsp:Transcript_26183/g.43325  ORF Transcript_26183/g.43325 Transcript_26183/m.43325 type:complete len:126 (+) Transcript_26183:76-453(+)
MREAPPLHNRACSTDLSDSSISLQCLAITASPAKKPGHRRLASDPEPRARILSELQRVQQHHTGADSELSQTQLNELLERKLSRRERRPSLGPSPLSPPSLSCDPSRDASPQRPASHPPPQTTSL